jgi:polyhydroxybutyrate depolymerase
LKKYFPILFICFFSLSFLQAQQTESHNIVHDGLDREYHIYIPVSYDGATSVPLLFVFHGYGGNARDLMRWGDMRSVADTAGFILIVPQGYKDHRGSPHWNVGSWTIGSTVDDIGFIEKIINRTSDEFNLDLKRVYSYGHSNGGYFSFELACQLGNKIAAIGSIGGTMSTESYDSCEPSHNTSVITVHGTSDPIVYYTGGRPYNSKSQVETLRYWVDFNNTNISPEIIEVPDSDKNDGSQVELYKYDGGTNGTSVHHFKVINGGHSWPGRYGNMDIIATSEIWKFVSKFNIEGLISNESTYLEEEIKSGNSYGIKLEQNYPNPFNPSTNIDFYLPEMAQVSLTVYNHIGQKIINVVDRKFLKGNQSIMLNLNDFSSGLYLYKLATPEHSITKTMALIK